MTMLTEFAEERSTYVITTTFKNEAGGIVSPDTMFWSLVDKAGNIINGRNLVEISSPSSINNIVLSGNDLALTRSRVMKDKEERVLIVEGEYTSQTLGANIPYRSAVSFKIVNYQG